jgi:hypothetical protein
MTLLAPLALITACTNAIDAAPVTDASAASPWTIS